MNTSSAKAKGRRLQQKVRDLILEHLPELTTNDVRSTSMGVSGVDVQLSERARKAFPWAVEAKNQERLNIWDCFQQASDNALKEDLKPLLFIKRNKSDILVVMRAEDFFKEGN